MRLRRHPRQGPVTFPVGPRFRSHSTPLSSCPRRSPLPPHDASSTHRAPCSPALSPFIAPQAPHPHTITASTPPHSPCTRTHSAHALIALRPCEVESGIATRPMAQLSAFSQGNTHFRAEEGCSLDNAGGTCVSASAFSQTCVSPLFSLGKRGRVAKFGHPHFIFPAFCWVCSMVVDWEIFENMRFTLVSVGSASRLGPTVPKLAFQHLSEQPAYLLDGQLLTADRFLLVVLVLSRLDADIGELGRE